MYKLAAVILLALTINCVHKPDIRSLELAEIYAVRIQVDTALAMYVRNMTIVLFNKVMGGDGTRDDYIESIDSLKEAVAPIIEMMHEIDQVLLSSLKRIKQKDKDIDLLLMPKKMMNILIGEMAELGIDLWKN